MTFARPELLWLLLAGAPVIILHIVRRRRRRLRVPSLILWQRVLAAQPRRFGPGLLNALLSLLLILLTIGAASLAAADPRTGDSAPRTRPVLICVCASARMRGDRWSRAVRHVEEELARKAEGDPVMLLLVSDRPRIAAVGETDAQRVLDKLRALSPGLTGSDWSLAGPAMLDAVSAGFRVVAIGVRPELPAAGGIAVHSVEGENSGISAFGADIEGETIRVYLRASGAEGELVFRLGEREALRRPSDREVVVELPRGDGGWLSVALEPSSGPDFDDEARAWITPPRRLRVGVVAESGMGPFLRAALSVVGPLLDEKGSGIVPPERVQDAASRFDVMIFVGATPPVPLPAGSWILLTGPPVELGLTPLPAAESAPIWEHAADHPVTRGVDAAEVQVAGAVPVALPTGAEALLSVPGGAVAAAGEREGVRFVWIGLDPENSTFPVTGAYPLMIRNALRWFAGLLASPLPPSVRMGEAVSPSVRLPRGLNAVALTGPGGADQAVLEIIDGGFAYLPASRAEGEVKLRIGEEEHRTYVNALLPAETEAQPLPGSPSPAYGPDRSGLQDDEQSLWPWFVAAAALFLLLEWMLPRK